MTYEDDAAELRGAHIPAGDIRPVRTVPDPADIPPRTAAAIAANVQRRLDRNIQELRDLGYAVTEPGTLAMWPRILREVATGHRPVGSVDVRDAA